MGDRPVQSVLSKLQFWNDAHDPFDRGGGWFGSHPDIDERVARSHETRTAPFPPDALFHGVRRDGTLVATLRFDVQHRFRNELDVVATLLTTATLGGEDNVNTINLLVDGRGLELKERTAEKIFPSDEVSAVFGNDRGRGLIEGPFSVEMKLRNVDRWERATVPDDTP